MPEHKHAVIFDLDGTLIDSTNLILTTMEHIWQKVYGASPSRESVLKTFGIPLRGAMRQLLDTCDVQPSWSGNSNGDEIIERLLSEYRAFNLDHHDILTKPFENISEVLGELRSRNYLIGIATSKTRHLTIRGLKLCSIEGLIDECVCVEDTTRHKPLPEPILEVLERLKASSENAYYVGDSPHDIIAGRAAKVKTVAALWGPASRSDLERAAPDHFAAIPNDLLSIFHV